jgi:hypothetical protein
VRVNHLARTRGIREPFVVHAPRFRGRGPVAALVRALGGLAAFTTAADVSPSAVRSWIRNGVVPAPAVADRVKALARAEGTADPFPSTRRGLPRHRGPLADTVRALGGVAAFASSIQVSETSVYRWLNKRCFPWRHVAKRANALAGKMRRARPFALRACPRRPPERSS